MKNAVRDILASAVRAWAADQSPAVTTLDVSIDPAPPNVPGDWASNYPLSVAKAVRKAPRQIAQEILDRLPLGGPIAKAEIAGPGFLNFTLSPAGLVAELNRLRSERDNYGRRPEATGEKVLIEFVSANPNGPLHVGHGRGAALGDSLARLFRHAGFDVTTEYYINNIGNQMENLGASVLWRIDGLAPDYLAEEEKAAYRAKKPEDLYKGAYLIDVARDILRRFPKGAPRRAGIPFFRDEALAFILDSIRRDLESFGVHHQNWYPESRLYEEGRVDAAFQKLRGRGDIKDEDGAVWFLSTKYGDDKDRVLKRQDERPTYFASDIAYHDEKFRRGFHRLIDIWGTDHHGYVARVKAGARALGHDPDRLQILLYQLVTLVRGGKPVAMSTRTGEFVTLSEVVQEVGKDASRFFFALRGPNSHLEFDLDLAKKQASDNPVFYVKYVHARCCSLFREAAKRGSVDSATTPVAAPSALEPAERDLLVRLAAFPDVIGQCVKDLTPHHITEYLLKLAGGYHRFYETCRVLGSASDQERFRLALVDGVRTVIKSGLGLLGVDAPEEM